MSKGKSLEEKIMQGRQYRSCTEMRISSNEDDSCKVEGYATVFEKPYLLYSNRSFELFEVVDKHALDEADLSDVIMQYDHSGRVFARTRNNTLKIDIDGKGLKVNADLSGTKLGREIHEEIKGGYTDRMSYCYIPSKTEETYVEDEEIGKTIITRRIMKISKVYDVSAVSIPANDATIISARSAFDGVIERLKSEGLKMPDEKADEQRKLLKLKLKLMEV